MLLSFVVVVAVVAAVAVVVIVVVAKNTYCALGSHDTCTTLATSRLCSSSAIPTSSGGCWLWW